MKQKIERWIVLPDMQVPFEDRATMKAVEAYMAGHFWDGYINLGDFLDFNELSRFNEGKPGAIKERVDESFERGREILKCHSKILRGNNSACKMVLLEGNHEYRATDYTLKHPELGKSLDVTENLKLKELGIEWVPTWSKQMLYKKGNAHFTHGRYIGKFHAHQMLSAYNVCVYYGHTHDVQEFSRACMGSNKALEAASLGCLCRHDQSYLKGSPTNWSQAFGVFHFFPDGYYNRYTVRIFKNRFVSPEGKVYGGV